MVKLNPGNVSAKLSRIASSPRSRRWRKAARRHLLEEAGAEQVRRSAYRLPKGGYVCGKVGFASASAALAGLENSARSLNPNRREKRIYPCPLCGRWHLTSQKSPTGTGVLPHGDSEENPDH